MAGPVLCRVRIASGACASDTWPRSAAIPARTGHLPLVERVPVGADPPRDLAEPPRVGDQVLVGFEQR